MDHLTEQAVQIVSIFAIGVAWLKVSNEFVKAALKVLRISEPSGPVVRLYCKKCRSFFTVLDRSEEALEKLFANCLCPSCNDQLEKFFF